MQKSAIKTFYLNQRYIAQIILHNLRYDNIIYGAAAINVQLPTYLRRHTVDIDVFSKDPENDAARIAIILNKYFNGYFFEVSKAEHNGTFKIRSIINQECYADFTLQTEKIPFIVIGNHRYADKGYIFRKTNEAIKSFKSIFRQDKDKDSINRISLYL